MQRRVPIFFCLFLANGYLNSGFLESFGRGRSIATAVPGYGAAGSLGGMGSWKDFCSFDWVVVSNLFFFLPTWGNDPI